MAITLKRSYTFALNSALYITIFSTVFVALLSYYFFSISFLFSLLFALGMFLFTFVIIQFGVELLIHNKVKKIYDDVSLIEGSSYRNQPITTDIETLTKEVKKFAVDKKVEIETLKIREEYRKEFLGNVSHELKTPLFTIQGYLLTLIDGAVDDIVVRDKYLDRAEKGVERLIHIVKDLDMITKFEAGSLNIVYSSFDILELVQNVFDLLEMKAAKKSITLTFDMKHSEQIWVYADKEKVEQVVTNLVVNSIKYGKTDGTTEVSIEHFVKNKVMVRVTDNGEGIERHHIQRLFERFYRVDKSGARSEGGSGLGLSIVKHIIEAHNEKIYLESEFGVGSEFSFTLEKKTSEA